MCHHHHFKFPGAILFPASLVLAFYGPVAYAIVNDAEQEKQLSERTSNADSKMVEEVSEEKIEVETEVRKEYGSMGMLGASITYAYSKIFEIFD